MLHMQSVLITTRGILGKTFLGVFGAAAGFKLSCPYPGMGNSIVRRPSAGWPALGNFEFYPKGVKNIPSGGMNTPWDAPVPLCHFTGIFDD